ncbi:acyl carrier protein [Streptomyces sp. GESEQ-35]|uniref:acyl carrier protein n=1 Tax=Streptomyces sp. GESEQ-35 TaxID=2812657 RepID=UPI001B330B86|nr:acyl carrier protein [Streptomyces sp. GESEQ-35]
MQYAQAVKEFVVKEFLPDVPAEELADDLDLMANGVIDSLGLLKVIAWLEDRYGVNTDAVDLDPESFTSVAAIASFLADAPREHAGAA